MIKVALVCDNCGTAIADGISANEVRFQSEALYRRREGKDMCLGCEAAALAAPAPAPPDPANAARQPRRRVRRAGAR
jgi:hypothetical protein